MIISTLQPTMRRWAGRPMAAWPSRKFLSYENWIASQRHVHLIVSQSVTC